MKKLFICGLLSVGFYHCSEKTKTIAFVPLQEKEFNNATLKIPDNKAIVSKRQSHDSCMGFSFDANAILVHQKDSITIGSIVNKQSLKIAGTLNDLGLSQAQMGNRFTVITNPCYEKSVLNFPLRLIVGDNFILQLPGAADNINKEINADISASKDADIQTGSWVYLDLKDALQNILDTIQSTTGLQYKKNLLDTSNMVLTAIESITDVNFIINTGKDISEPLQAILKTKPAVSLQGSAFSIRLSYIDYNRFEMSLNGFFPLAGQFMKAEIK